MFHDLNVTMNLHLEFMDSGACATAHVPAYCNLIPTAFPQSGKEFFFFFYADIFTGQIFFIV